MNDPIGPIERVWLPIGSQVASRPASLHSETVTQAMMKAQAVGYSLLVGIP